LFIFWKAQEAGQTGRQPRRRSKKRLRALLFIVSLSGATTAAYAQSTQWDSILSNSNWYVPVPGLIAYGSGNVSFYRPPPIAFGDQTLWALGTATNGVFTGQSNAVFDINGISSTSAQSMQGVVSTSGQIAIVFSQPGAPSTIGIGQMREVNGVPLMEMQMVTGSSFLVSHWAYMTPYNPAVFTPPSPSKVVTGDLTSPQWRWTAGTTWRISSPTLFGTSAPGTFKISSYNSGYYWGLGAAPPGSSVGNFTMLGSITPEGNVLFSLLSNGVLSSLSGQITGDPTTGTMVLRPYLGDGNFGSSSGADIMPVSSIQAGQTFFISNVGSTVIPTFAGGTLQVDTIGQTYSQNFILENSPTNRLDQRGGSAVLSGVLSDAVPGAPGQLIIANSAVGGGITFSGANTYTGPTTVESGATLVVDGSIVSPLTVAGTLGGSGVVANTTIAGGVLSPGNSIGTLTVNGNLSFAPGAVYLVEVAPGAADRTNVSGSASLQGTAVASFASGNYTPTPQVVLSAAGGRSGTFGNLVTLGLPSGLLASLSYTPSDVMVNLTAVLGAGTTLTANQSNVAGALNNSFNTGNSLPGGMAGLFNQSGQTLAASLNSLSGEAQSGVQVAAFGYGNLFLNTVLASGTAGGTRQGVQYASLTAAEAEPGPRRLRGWLTGFGGYGWLGGTPSNGSSGVQTSAQGIAAGTDWSFDHGLAGVAVSGGTSNWFLDGSLGNGRANVFQVGLYGRAMLDPVYLAAATAWGRQGVSTQRAVPFLGDWLGASYTATTWSGRLEAGHRFAQHGLTPFAAVQSQVVNMPAFCETSQVNSGAALCFNGNATWSLRSELGLELDADVGTILGSKASLGARLAWAHEYQTTGAVSAWFQSLPGSNFSVSGAPLPQDAGIIRVTSNLALDEAWSLRLQGDAEFGNNYGSIAGTVRLARRF
jgi:autotransporter-associated beta strand protein